MLRKLYRDERGQVLLMFTIMVPVIVGMIGLALEGGRLLMLNSQLQDLADASAIAGAKELDSESDAITRATAAANAMSQRNNPWWSDVAMSGVQLSSVIFYSHLKGDINPKTGAAYTSDATTTDPTEASYVKVTTVTRGVTPAFLTVVGASTIGNTEATATASSTYVACNVQPLMLCNPFEPAPYSKEFKTAVSDGTVSPGMQFHLKILNDTTPSGSNQSYAPGDFGLLDPPGMNSSGANLIRNLLSQQNPNFCYVNNVSPRTGQAVQKVNDGINVRFDIPANGPGGADFDTSPAADVIKGYLPDANFCSNPTKYTDHPEWRLPRDTGAPTAYGNMTIGSGNLDSSALATYMTAHFGAGATWPTGTAPGQANRYEAYKQELSLTNVGSEPMAPICQTTPSTAGADRRIISVAVVDCLANGVKGNSVTSVKTNTYIDIFLTEPSTSGEVWGEFVRVMTPTSSGSKLHHIVQLVRDR